MGWCKIQVIINPLCFTATVCVSVCLCREILKIAEMSRVDLGYSNSKNSYLSHRIIDSFLCILKGKIVR